MGLGAAGGAVNDAIYFCKKGARVLVTDTKTESELSFSVEKLREFSVDYVLGEHRHENFKHADLIVQNPFVKPDSPYLQTARANNIPIEMSVSLFMKNCPTKNIIGVTGTRGKSTTATMIYEAIKQAGKDVVFGGNVRGVSTVSLLDRVTKQSWVVLELSSWQLQSFGWNKISPRFALITNLYQDHLNFYHSMEEYAGDKEHIFLHQERSDIALFNKKNKYTQAMHAKASSNREWFNATDWPSNEVLSIPGPHNIENAAAAIRILELAGFDRSQAVQSIRLFKGVPGRLEFIREVNGVKFYNDTTSTTPVSGIKAIEAFPKGKIILIAGGNSKQLSMKRFVSKVNEYVKYTVLFDGTASDELEGIQSVSEPIDMMDTSTAVEIAVSKAEPGDTVLFSPATTHLPIINEFKRGEAFVTQVKAL